MAIVHNSVKAGIGDIKLFQSVARLKFKYVSFSNKETESGATGFILREKKDLWLITSKHCIDVQYGKLKEYSLGIKEFVAEIPAKIVGDLPITIKFDVSTVEFLHSKNSDVSAVLLKSGELINGSFEDVKYLETTTIAKEGMHSSIHSGSEVMFIGYPKNLWDSKNSLPILRTADVSSIFHEFLLAATQ
jgi:hypothetical protein